MVESLRVSDFMHEITDQIARSGKVETAFGEPKEIKGQVVIPVAKVRGGAGGGAGGQKEHEEQGEGLGAGIGLEVRPLGWLVISDNRAKWQPALDTTRVITVGTIFGIFALLTLRSIFKKNVRARRHAKT